MSNEFLHALTADIVAAHVSNNRVSSEELPSLIATTYTTLASLNAEPNAASEGDRPKPAVTVRQSLADPKVIRSMIDGKPYALLKRHLGQHGYTPQSYREAFGLKPDYPMVAPAYSAMRSEAAKRLGLGRKKVVQEPAAEPQQAEPVAELPQSKRGKLRPTFDG